MVLDGAALQAALAVGAPVTLSLTASVGFSRRSVVDISITGGLSERVRSAFPGWANLRPSDIEYVLVLGLRGGRPVHIREVGVISLDHGAVEGQWTGVEERLTSAIVLRADEDRRTVRIPSSQTLRQGIPLSTRTVPYATTEDGSTVVGPIHHGFDPYSWDDDSWEHREAKAAVFHGWERDFGIPVSLSILSLDGMGERYLALRREFVSRRPWGARAPRAPLSRALGYPALGRKWRPGKR